MTDPDYKFELESVDLREGKYLTTYSNLVLMVSESLGRAEMWQKTALKQIVIKHHTIKPLDEELLVEAAKETGERVVYS